MSADISALVETLYWDLEREEKNDRLNMLGAIANPRVYFDSDEADE